jgi:hypothetical protein
MDSEKCITIAREASHAYAIKEPMGADKKIFLKFTMTHSGSSKEVYLEVLNKILTYYSVCKGKKSLEEAAYLRALIDNFDSYISFAKSRGWVKCE